MHQVEFICELFQERGYFKAAGQLLRSETRLNTRQVRELILEVAKISLSASGFVLRIRLVLLSFSEHRVV